MTHSPKDAPKANIYTKTGDQGQTRLVDGRVVEKSDPRVEAYGTIDELNSHIGLARSWFQIVLEKSNLPKLGNLELYLQQIQNNLFVVGSHLACESAQVRATLPALPKTAVEDVEKHIDLMTAEMPVLKNFILPAGHQLTSQLHVARTVCRRAERRCFEVCKTDPLLNTELIYLNRLSDFLFTAARFVQIQLHLNEVIWTAQK